MAGEHRCQAPRLCANNCGFFGSPATQDLCSKCYRDLQLKEHQSSNAKLAFTQTLTSSSSSSAAASILEPSVESSGPVRFPILERNRTGPETDHPYYKSAYCLAS